MSNLSIETFAKRVRPEVAGCPGPIVNDAIVQAAIRLCAESRIWVERLTAIDVFADIGEYELIGPYPSEVVAPLAVQFNEIPLSPTTMARLDTSYTDWRDLSATRPSWFFMASVRHLRLYPMPDADASGALTVTAELAPDRDATELPKWLHDDYREAIEHGALASLLAMGKRAWSDPAKAGTEQRAFSYAISQAKRARYANFNTAPVSVRLRRFV